MTFGYQSILSLGLRSVTSYFERRMTHSHCAARKIGEYHQMKIDFILTVPTLLSNLWDTSRQAGDVPNHFVGGVVPRRFRKLLSQKANRCGSVEARVIGRVGRRRLPPREIGDEKWSEALRSSFRHRGVVLDPGRSAGGCHRVHQWGSARPVTSSGQGSAGHSHEYSDQPLPA